jgi:hypothetical protein
VYGVTRGAAQGRTENVISSLKRLYLALFLIWFADLYLSSVSINEISEQKNLITLDTVLAIRAIIKNEIAQSRLVTWEDLAAFSTKAEEEVSAINDKLWEAAERNERSKIEELRDELKRKYPNRIIGSGLFYENISLPFSARKRCNAVVFRGHGSKRIAYWTQAYYSEIAFVDSKDVGLVVFAHGCGPARAKEFTALIFENKGDIALGLPFREETSFLNPLAEVAQPPLFEEVAIREVLAQEIQNYIQLEPQYWLIDLKAIDLIVLDLLGQMHNRQYSLGELQSAVRNMYERERVLTDFLGVKLDYLLFLKLVPFGLLVLTFLIWRHLKVLGEKQIETEQYWVALDSHDLLGTLCAYLWAIFVLLVVANVYLVYPFAFDTLLILFGREISVPGLLMLDFPEAWSPGWYGFDYVAYLTMWLLIVQLAFAILVTLLGVKLVYRNQRYDLRMDIEHLRRSRLGRINVGKPDHK